jgi:hypothetical protein
MIVHGASTLGFDSDRRDWLLSEANPKAVPFCMDVNTLFAREPLHIGPIRQAATSVIRILLTHYLLEFNRK